MLFISRVLVPQPGTESEPLAVEAWSLNHWTPREVSVLFILKQSWAHGTCPKKCWLLLLSVSFYFFKKKFISQIPQGPVPAMLSPAPEYRVLALSPCSVQSSPLCREKILEGGGAAWWLFSSHVCRASSVRADFEQRFFLGTLGV